MLLNVQYQQIVRPIQRAYAEKRTRVNPASFLLVDERELRQFWKPRGLKTVRGDKHEISESIEPPRKRPPRTPEERVSNLFPALCGRGWRHDAGDTGGRVLGYLVRRRRAPDNGKLRTAQDEPLREAPSARERSIIWGITWDAFTMRAAIERNDTRVTALFSVAEQPAARVDGAGVCGRTYRGAATVGCVIPR